jgi:hypothetical protein
MRIYSTNIIERDGVIMYIKNKECEVSKMEESVVLMKKDDNTLHILNETASLIWENIENNNIDEIVIKITTKYNAETAIVEQDVNQTIEHLLEKKLLFKEGNDKLETSEANGGDN